MKTKPCMTAVNRVARVSWATNHISWNQDQWKAVIWSDEKIILDGLDGRGYYWSYSQITPIVFSNHQVVEVQL